MYDGSGIMLVPERIPKRRSEMFLELHRVPLFPRSYDCTIVTQTGGRELMLIESVMLCVQRRPSGS